VRGAAQTNTSTRRAPQPRRARSLTLREEIDEVLALLVPADRREAFAVAIVDQVERWRLYSQAAAPGRAERKRQAAIAKALLAYLARGDKLLKRVSVDADTAFNVGTVLARGGARSIRCDSRQYLYAICQGLAEAHAAALRELQRWGKLYRPGGGHPRVPAVDLWISLQQVCRRHGLTLDNTESLLYELSRKYSSLPKFDPSALKKRRERSRARRKP